MPRTCKTQERYLHGTINPGQRGKGWDCYIRVDGKSYRSRQPTPEDARRWIEMIEDQTAANRPPLTKLQLEDAKHALAILPPGYTLTDAARAITPEPDREPVPLPDALERFISAKSLVAKDVTLTSYRQTIERLIRLIGPVQTGAVTPDQIETMLAGLKPVTRNSQLRNIAAFFNWCHGEGIIKETRIEGEPYRLSFEPGQERALAVGSGKGLGDLRA